MNVLSRAALDPLDIVADPRVESRVLGLSAANPGRHDPAELPVADEGAAGITLTRGLALLAHTEHRVGEETGSVGVLADLK